MSPGFSRELTEAIAGAFQDKDTKAVVLTGTGKNFIAGADITQLYAEKEKDTIHQVAMDGGPFLQQH
jgi:enoyl-CoA hydratase/carnithine racemase